MVLSRSEKHNTEEIKKNTCFICGLERKDFDNKNVTFEVQSLLSQAVKAKKPICHSYPGSCQQGAQHVELSVVHCLDKGDNFNLIPLITNSMIGERSHRVHRARELCPLDGEGKGIFQSSHLKCIFRTGAWTGFHACEPYL